jgi:hypothetical protein
MPIRDLFVHDITRDIPPVVYFHDLDPNKVRSEVDEYIVTGGFPDGHPGKKLVPDGIHEQYVRLLDGLVAELSQPNGGTSPGCWVSGFFGSGKSSFAKLFALALDGFELADGTPLADRWLARDQTPKAEELRRAWARLHETLGTRPIAVVFDVGAVAKDGEHVHAAVVRQVQARLGYARDEVVAREEIKLERDGLRERFLALAQEVHHRPWSELVGQARVARHFSVVMHRLDPVAYQAPLEWMERHSGGIGRAQSADEAVGDLQHMLETRAAGRTLFVVVDEVSQYVISGDDRIGKLQAFVELLGARLRGAAWLVALGQQKLEEDAASKTDLPKLKDRFPKRLRVHLDPANIRDVVHQRLLRKRPAQEGVVRHLFKTHRAAIEAHALGGSTLSEDEFVATYPLLPSYVDLLLRITSAIRRSSRAQADDHEIRGLLQLLGEVFRTRGHADRDLGVLVCIDDIYEVQRTALDSETQQSMNRVLNQCGDDPLYARVAKAVALLQLVQDESVAGTGGTDALLVTKALFDRVDAGDRTEAVFQALEAMRRQNLLGYSERTGYKIQSSAAEEWERERRDIDVSAEQIGELVRAELTDLVKDPDKPRFKGQPFPVAARFSDDAVVQDVPLVDARDPAALVFDFRWVRDASDATWTRRSGETALLNRIVWVAASVAGLKAAAEELGKSLGMLRKLEPSYKTNTLLPGRKMLYLQEEGRKDELLGRLRKEVDAAWTHGAMYFRGRKFPADEFGATFAQAALAAGVRLLPDLFPEFVPTQVSPSELALLVPDPLPAPSTKFLGGELGLLDTDRGRYVATCAGVVPQRVEAAIQADKGLPGTLVLAKFGAPPYGWNTGVVKAAIAALLRASRIRVTLEDGTAVTSIKDAGVPDLFDKDRAFRRATYFPAGDDVIGTPMRNKIRKFLESAFGDPIDATNEAIADVVGTKFPTVADRLHEVQRRIAKLVRRPPDVPGLAALEPALAACVRRSRNTQATVEAVAANLDKLKDGIAALDRVARELTDAGLAAVNRALGALDPRLAQLAEVGPLAPELAAARERLVAQVGQSRPWDDIASVEADVVLAEVAYQGARATLLADQQARCDAAKATVSGRAGFEKLSADDGHDVLSPIDAARATTTSAAVLPSLCSLRDTFDAALARAVAAANDRLDRLLTERAHPVVRVESKLTNREVGSEAELDALLVELRALIAPHVAAGRRVRLT